MIRRACLGLLLMSGIAGAQSIDVATPYRAAVERYERGDIDGAAARLEELVAIHDRDAIATIGPAFGNVWYHLGCCWMQRGDLARARLAFQRCHTQYANPPQGEGGNAFAVAAVIKRAEIEQALEQYAAAMKLYAVALREKPPPELRHRMLMNLAICLHETGDLAGAARVCGTVLADGAVPPALRRLAILQTCRIAVEQNDVSSARAVLNANPALAEAPILERMAWTRVLLHTGRRCTLLDDPVLALQFYELAASGSGADDTWNRQAARVIAGWAPPESVPRRVDLAGELLLARADAWFQLEAWRLARSAYAEAENAVSEDRHPQILHAVSVCSSMLDESDRAGDAAYSLIDIAPDYGLLPEVMGAWIESLLRTGREREARSVALEEREGWTAGDPQREPLDFLAALAAFRLEAYGAAGVEFGDYLQQHPSGTRRTEASYSRAVCHLHQRRWDEARSAFDAVLREPSAGPWTDGALYYRAFCDTLDGHAGAAEADLKLLLVAHPQSPHRGPAWNLLGDLRVREENWEQAEEMYAQAEASNEPEAAAYAAYQRIRIAIAQADHTLALERYQAFREHYPDSDTLPDASVAAAQVQEAQGQAADAITLLTGDILERADRARDDGLEILMHAHSALYTRTHGYQALIARLRDFPGPEPRPRPLAAWLALAEIEALESVGDDEAAARLQDQYRFLAVDYELDELSGIFILKLARWLARTDDVDSAISYYTMLTSLRDEPAFLQQARIERARLLLSQSGSAPRIQAMEDLQRVLDETELPELREAASVEMARHRFASGEFAEARTRWEGVLAESDWLIARGEATYALAVCLDQLGLREEARRQYVSTYVLFEGQIDWSAPAFLRTALMANEDGDLTRARGVLDDMMARMGHLDHPVVNRARTLHRTWMNGGAP